MKVNLFNKRVYVWFLICEKFSWIEISSWSNELRDIFDFLPKIKENIIIIKINQWKYYPIIIKFNDLYCIW